MEVVDGVAEETTTTRTEVEVGVSLDVVDDDDLTVSVGVSEGVVSVVVSTVEEVFRPPGTLVREVVWGAAGEEVVGVIVSLVEVGGGGSPPPPPKPPPPVLPVSPPLALGVGGEGLGRISRRGRWARIARWSGKGIVCRMSVEERVCG